MKSEQFYEGLALVNSITEVQNSSGYRPTAYDLALVQTEILRTLARDWQAQVISTDSWLEGGSNGTEDAESA